MDGLKNLVTILALLLVVVAVSAPSMAQSYAGQMNPQQGMGGAQQPQQGQAGQGGMPQSNKNLADTISGMPKISMFAAAVKAGAYDDMLTGQGPYMVFAPTDDAVQNVMGITDVNTLTNDKNAVTGLVEDSIVYQVNQQQGQQSNTGQMTMKTLSGKTITASKSNGKITVNGVKVLYATKTTNGILVITDGLVGGAPSTSGAADTSGAGGPPMADGAQGM